MVNKIRVNRCIKIWNTVMFLNRDSKFTYHGRKKKQVGEEVKQRKIENNLKFKNPKPEDHVP